MSLEKEQLDQIRESILIDTHTVTESSESTRLKRADDIIRLDAFLSGKDCSSRKKVIGGIFHRVKSQTFEDDR